MKILVTGGCGFIGTNLSSYFIEKGYDVLILDNLSRENSWKNFSWLKEKYNNRFRFIEGDIRNSEIVSRAVMDCNVIFHFAAQVAVTTSVYNPRDDFEINALGTLNILESSRKTPNKPLVIYTSTNKVYGEINRVSVKGSLKRYFYEDILGISEEEKLDFHSPYGCSKGAADQYVRDYSRIYEIPTVVFRMSCIYGPHQFGNEDQGWVAHFIISAILNRKITIYGNGKQVRDILYIDDLIKAFEITIQHQNVVSGQIFNIGGGPDNSISLLELVELLENELKKKIDLNFGEWRPGDQKIYLTNIDKVKSTLGWDIKVNLTHGIKYLIEWASANTSLF